jgi:hypothetical protein
MIKTLSIKGLLVPTETGYPRNQMKIKDLLMNILKILSVKLKQIEKSGFSA